VKHILGWQIDQGIVDPWQTYEKWALLPTIWVLLIMVLGGGACCCTWSECTWFWCLAWLWSLEEEDEGASPNYSLVSEKMESSQKYDVVYKVVELQLEESRRKSIICTHFFPSSLSIFSLTNVINALLHDIKTVLFLGCEK